MRREFEEEISELAKTNVAAQHIVAAVRNGVAWDDALAVAVLHVLPLYDKVFNILTAIESLKQPAPIIIKKPCSCGRCEPKRTESIHISYGPRQAE